MPLLCSQGSHFTHSPYGGAHRPHRVWPPVASLLASCHPLPSLTQARPLPSPPQGLRSGVSLCSGTLFRRGAYGLLRLLKRPLPSVLFPERPPENHSLPPYSLSLLLA